jgi:transposase
MEVAMTAKPYDKKKLAKLVKNAEKMSEVNNRVRKALKEDSYFRDRPNASFVNVKRALKDGGFLKKMKQDTKGITTSWSKKRIKEFREDCKAYRENPDTTIKNIREKYGLKDEWQVRNIAKTLGVTLARRGKKRVKGNNDKIDAEAWLDFFSGSKTTREAAEHFKVSHLKVKKKLKQIIPDYKLYKHNDILGERLYVYLPEFKDSLSKSKIWSYVMEKTGKPGVAINLPSDVGWRKKTRKKHRKEKIRIVPISDVWLKHPRHDGANFEERLNWIARESHVFAILNGDILYPQPFGSKKERGKNFAKVVEELRVKLSPISHKILWAQAGCFEEKYERTDELFDPIEYLCNEWDIPYFKTPCYNIISWKKHLFYFYCIHGRSVAQKRGSKLNAAVRPLEFTEFTHFFVMSHIKDNITKKIRRVRRGLVDLILKKQYVAICPSFVKYDESREARWGYVPPSRGQLNFVLYANGDYHLYTSPQQEFEEIIIL